MPRRTWKLTDVENDVHLAELHLTPADVADAVDGFTLHKRTLSGGLRQGVEVVDVVNGPFRFTVIPSRGMGLWRAAYGATQIGWRSPVKGPVNPSFVPVEAPSGIGWLQGFDELLCRCGLEFNGAPEWSADGKLLHSLHGRIANLPAHLVEAAIDTDSGEIAVTGVVDEARLFGNNLRLRSTVSTRLGNASLQVTDEITNISARPAELELLYHINIGPPLAAPGSQLIAPIETMAPRDLFSATDISTWQAYGQGEPGAREVVLYCELAAAADGQTAAVLVAPSGEQALSLKFNRRQLPLFAIWKSQQPEADSYVTGLEPAINWPNVKSFERQQGRVATLAPGETRTFSLTLEIHPDAASVEGARQMVDELARGTTPAIYDRPRPEWSPV